MSWFTWICLSFLIWIVLGLVFKTKTPIRYLGYRFNIIKPPPIPPPEFDRWDLEE